MLGDLVSAAVSEFVDVHELTRSEPYLVAVSGGRDSVALLLSLHQLGFERLTVAHLNHGLRGADSDGDNDFVQQLCVQLGVDFISKKVSLEGAAGGFEKVARDARYSFFADLVQEHRFSGVFLGHHADDQVETVLYNIFRGSAGLRGMEAARSRKVDGVELILLRPLLQVRRNAITDFVEQSTYGYREDATNADPITARNRMRNELLPLANEILGRDVVPMVLRASEASHSDQQWIDESIDYTDYLDPQGRLFLPKLENMAKAIQGRVVKHYLELQDVPNISTDLLVAAIGLIGTDEVAKINLPSGRYLRRKEKRMFVEGSGSSA